MADKLNTSLSSKRRPSSQRYRGKTHNPRRDIQAVVTQHELRGGQLSVPSNPPNVSYQPWNHLTVVHTGSSQTVGEITIKLQDLVNQIAGQIDPIHTGLVYDSKKNCLTIFNIKLQRIRAWNITGHMIALSVDDFSDIPKAIADADTLCGLVDTGSNQHTPAVGYDLPASHKSIVLRNGNTDSSAKTAVLYHVMAPSTDTVIVYTTVLWKFDGPLKFSAFESTMMKTVRKIAANTKATANRDIADIARDVQSTSKKLGIGKLLIDGIETAAPMVMPVIGAIEDRLDAIHSELARLNLDKVRDDVLLKDWVTNLSADVKED